MLFNGPANPSKIAPSLRGSEARRFLGAWAHPSHQQRHQDRFSRFLQAHEREQQKDRHTDIQTNRATPSVAIGCI